MAAISNGRMPFGVRPPRRSPPRCPSSALAIGEAADSLPSAAEASCDATIVNVCSRPALWSVNDTVEPKRTSCWAVKSMVLMSTFLCRWSFCFASAVPNRSLIPTLRTRADSFTLAMRSTPGRWRLLAQPVLERALHAGVQRIEAVERECLRRGEPPAGRGRGTVVCQDAMQQRQPARLVQLPAARQEDLLSNRHMTEQPPLVGQPELGAVGELAGAAEVVGDRRGEQQVGVHARM